MIKSKYINDILDLLLDGDDEGISTKKQLEYLSEDKFNYTGSGVFVTFAHTENARNFKTEKLDFVLDGVTVVSSEYPIECYAILFLTEGIIDYLEIWCFNGEDYPQKDLIKYTLTQTWTNSPEKTISTETTSH